LKSEKLKWLAYQDELSEELYDRAERLDREGFTRAANELRKQASLLGLKS
jgi:hypothetical protein